MKYIFCIFLLLISFTALPTHADLNESSCGPADYLFLNGYVYTVDPANPVSEAVAVKGNQIIYVGNIDEAQQFRGSDTLIINLSGAMLMPGFIDGHNHIISGALQKQGIKLTGARNFEEVIERIQEYVTSHPDMEVYTGYDWDFYMFQGTDPTRHDLDTITNKPIILFNTDTHNAWFNTRAMEMANISNMTKDPSQSSYYLREPDGTPSGIAYEAEAYQPIFIAMGLLNGSESLEREMEDIIPRLPRAGITSVHDMGIYTEKGLSEGYMGFDLLRKWEEKGKLPCRVVGVYGLRTPSGTAEDHVAILKKWNETYQSNLITVNSLKIWSDGTYQTFTGVQLEPYANNPNTTGESVWTSDLLTEYITTAYKEGFNVQIHTIGDSSLRRCLDAFEASKEYRPVSGRSTLHHLNIIHPDDLPRFSQLNITGDATLEWLTSDWNESLAYFGEERRDSEYDVWNRLIDQGVNVTFGSDMPGTNPDELAPLYQMQVALTGKIPGRTIVSTPPTWRIPSRERMIFGYTAAGAYQMGKENEIGTITTGKKADLIILNKNILTIPAEELNQMRILLTMMDGNVTYLDESSELSFS